jgi:hypothetical protein
MGSGWFQSPYATLINFINDSLKKIQHLIIESRLYPLHDLSIKNMSNQIKSDDVIFNFFKQVCDEKNDPKCVELGNSWIKAMETNLTNMVNNLDDSDKIKHKENINNNHQHLNSLKGKTASEWREYATQCMVEILNHKKKS